MDIYTVTAEIDDGLFRQIRVKARAHFQHTWNETTLLGVTRTGADRLGRFFRATQGTPKYVNAGPYNPRLIGWCVD